MLFKDGNRKNFCRVGDNSTFLCIFALHLNDKAMEMKVHIKQGIGDIRFWMPVEEVVALLGTADEVENIDNAADEPTTVLRYKALGLTLFFEGENPVLACIDTCNEECTLFDKQVFDLEEKALVRLMVEHGYAEQDVDEEDWGERRVSFPEGNVDFYFEEGEMMSIILGA